MRRKSIRPCLCGIVLVLFLSAATSQKICSLGTDAPRTIFELPEVSLDQTVNIRIAFLGIPQEYVNQSQLMSFLPQRVGQFAFPNTMTWTLNVSFAFCPFPKNVSDSLQDSAFYSTGSAYFNITLLETLLSQFQDLVIPRRGYLLTFMWIPNATSHSWFYVQERPDLFLNRTDYFNETPLKYWVFPPNFGGLHRALYFDISEAMEGAPVESVLASTVAKLINNSLGDIFTNLLGITDSRMIAADAQKYRNYSVKILWLNGTGQQLPLEPIKEAFQDLMPWTNWSVTIEARPVDSTLNDVIAGRTTRLSTPTNYTLLLSNGTSFIIEAQRNVDWNPFENSGENDPLNRYFFNHVKEYFNLTDLDDKSVVPVVLLQLDNYTAFGGSFQGGVSWFPYNVIIVGFQGSLMTALGESGPLELTHLLRHEIGHWVSLSHHSSYSGSEYPKIICSMRSRTNRFCSFCKDARARISFISYYNATIELLAKNQTKAAKLENELNDTLQLFYNWDYAEAVDTIASIYYALDTTPPDIIDVIQTPPQSNVLPEDEVKVNATVTDDLSGVRKVILNYTNHNGTWNYLDMTNIQGNFWNATIPIFPYGTNVTYTIVAEDNFNNTIMSQQVGLLFTYLVIPEFQVSAILLLAMLAMALATTVCRLKHQFQR